MRILQNTYRNRKGKKITCFSHIIKRLECNKILLRSIVTLENNHTHVWNIQRNMKNLISRKIPISVISEKIDHNSTAKFILEEPISSPNNQHTPETIVYHKHAYFNIIEELVSSANSKHKLNIAYFPQKIFTVRF